jgi:hypothetical protein
MKRLIAIGLMVGFLAASFCSIALAAPVVKKPGLVDTSAMTARAENLLESKEWVVYLTLVKDTKKTSAGTDVFTFSEGKIQSKKLTDLGYLRSNARLGTRQDGVSEFETMQKTQAGDTAFIRAQLNNGVLSGTMSIRPLKGDRTIYEYTSATPQAAEGAKKK